MTIKILLKPDPDADDEKMRMGFGPMEQKLKNSITIELLEDTESAGEPKKADSAPAS